MNRIRLFTAALVLACGLPLLAQQAASAPPAQMPNVDEHVKVLSEKLGLTADQKEKARPIVADMQDGLQKVMDDKSLTQDQRIEQSHLVYMKADKQLRVFLTDGQKTKLDELERPHTEKAGTRD